MLYLNTGLSPEEIAKRLDIDVKDVQVLPSIQQRKNNTDFYNELRNTLIRLNLRPKDEQVFLTNLIRYLIHCLDGIQVIKEVYMQEYIELTEDILEEDRLHTILKKLLHTWGGKVDSKSYKKWRGVLLEEKEGELDWMVK